MSMSEWAKREVEIACEKERNGRPGSEWNYGCACYESAYKAFQSLMEDDHSGCSIVFTKNILNRLIDGKPLTPINDVPEMWNDVTYGSDKKTLQCSRMSSLFKHIYADGRVEYNDVDRCRCVYKDDPDAPTWSDGFINQLINEKYPITMPYCPSVIPYMVYCTEGLHDRKNGDFDTIGIWYVKKPDGEKDTIERFFKETADGWAEIDEQEYFDRISYSSCD